MKEAESQNELLKAVKKTSEILLTSCTDNLGKTFLEAMDIMASSVGADRMYIWQKQFVAGKYQYVQQYKWLSEAEKKRATGAGCQSTCIDTIPLWESYLSAGKHINGPISSLSEDERSILAPFGIRSILAMPVFLQDKLWGFVNFDDCHRERTFCEDAVNMLYSGSLLLANTIVRCNDKKMIEERMLQQKLMAEISKSFISKEPIEKLINDAIKQIGEFLKVDRVLVSEIDKDYGGIQIVYNWLKSAELQPKPAQPEFREIILTSFPRVIPQTGFLTAVCCNDIIKEFQGKYKIFSKADIKSFIWAPVYVEGTFWGMVSLEACKFIRSWSESDIQLAGTVSSAIAGAMAREQIDKARNAAMEEAVRASQAKGNFLATMSHEIRTPMNAVVGMTAIGKNSRDLKKKDYAFEKIENASSHLLGVINDILDMSKIEANKLELSPVTFDFEKVLQKVVNVINFRVDERQQELSVHIDKHIPRLLVADEQRLAQVVTNLLSNAVKFTPEHGRIRLNACLAGEENGLYTIQIEVNDTGIGISQEQQSRLFKSFEQAESGTSRKYGGTGLGLAISRRIVELMGGQIWVESELGKGAAFGFTIQAGIGQGSFVSLLAPGVNINNIRILAIDDDPEALDYYSDVLSRFGIRCDIASGGEEALALVKKKGFYDLYFVDWRMPGMDGIEFSRKIQEFHSAEPDTAEAIVVMISAAEWRDSEENTKHLGINKFLSKPLFPSAIIDVINEYLNSNTGDDADPSSWDESKQEEKVNLKDYNILLVEDIEINREIVMTLLEPTALGIECAENGKVALEKFAANPDKYDMIFMDIQMPDMDGYEATKSIRSMELCSAEHHRVKQIPIIAMTANVFREDVMQCLAAGMNDHIGKPLDIKELLEKIEKFLPQKEQQQA